MTALFPATIVASAGESGFLWQIGADDQSNAEFALAPNHYDGFREDGFFVVGRSESKRDWAYVHPGPADAWAGGRSHTFSIVFGLKSAPASGECLLKLALLDTHSRSAPEIKISLNGREQTTRLPTGAGDESISGQPAKGKPHRLQVSFPATALKTGVNEIAITTVSGSWMLYDWIGFEAPAAAELGEATATVVTSIVSPGVLIQQGGSLMQPIQVTVRHLGDPAPAVLRFEGVGITNLTLNSATTRLQVPVRAVTQPKDLIVTVEVSGKVLATKTVTLKPVRKWVVYLLPHSHVDIGYTHVQTDVERAQWRYLEMAMETSRKSAGNPPESRFKGNTEVLWAVDSYLRQASPEKQKAFFEAVKSGGVGLDALYGNELTGLCRPEELLRLVDLAPQLAKRSGVPIVSAMITDVPGYTWGVVPAFAQAGIKYFSIGPNGGDRIGHTIAAWGDKPFWWIGPNGKDKVLVWMTGTGYYQVFRSADQLQSYLASLEAKGYPYDMVQVRHCLGDNGAPDVNFADTVRQWNETHAFPKLIIATTAQMFRDFEQRYGDRLPVAKGDFTPYWEDGAASSARETALNRSSADRLTQAETLYAMLRPQEYPAEDFYQAWRNVILYDEHTWGAHNSISEPDAPFVKSQWAIKQAFALEGDKQSRQLLAAALGSAPQANDSPKRVDVFNTSSWNRTDLVTLPAAIMSGDIAVEDSQGKPVLSQRLSTGELLFLAGEVPAFGTKRYLLRAGSRPAPSGARAEARGLATSALSLRVDEATGAIVSLRSERQAGRELVDPRMPLNSYWYLPGSDLKGLKPSGPARISIRERGPLVASLLIESDAPGCNQLSREIRVVEGLDRVEITDVVDKKAVRAKEGVHFGFGFNIPDGQLRMDVPWGVVRPELDQIAGACKNWFTVQRWVDISNDRFGVSWATPDAPLVQIGGITANLIGSLPDPRVWMDRIEPSSTIYSWAMNNHWHTNYRAEQEGPTVFRFWLWPHEEFRPDDSARFGLLCSQPLLALPASGSLPRCNGVSIEPAGVLATALKPSRDRKGLILRLFGASGRDETAEITWRGSKPKQVWITDATENPVSQVDRRIAVPAWTIVTLRFELTP